MYIYIYLCVYITYLDNTYHIFPEKLARYLRLAMCWRETFEMGSVAWHRPAAATGRGYSLQPANIGGSWYRS
jgi:hypothetical protein